MHHKQHPASFASRQLAELIESGLSTRAATSLSHLSIWNSDICVWASRTVRTSRDSGIPIRWEFQPRLREPSFKPPRLQGAECSLHCICALLATLPTRRLVTHGICDLFTTWRVGAAPTGCSYFAQLQRDGLPRGSVYENPESDSSHLSRSVHSHCPSRSSRPSDRLTL